MSWETRGNYRYYYRRRKVGGRVEAEYIDAGYLAEMLAGLDEIDRQTAAALADVDDLVRAAMTAVLIANGYHTHKRQWRRAKVNDG